jgi:hypothetical protein
MRGTYIIWLWLDVFLVVNNTDITFSETELDLLTKAQITTCMQGTNTGSQT